MAVGCGVEVAVGEVCSDEHDKRGNVKAIINMNILILKRILIGLLLVFFERGWRHKRPALLECNPKIIQFYRAYSDAWKLLTPDLILKINTYRVITFAMSKRGPGQGASVARLAREGSSFNNGFRPGAQCKDFARVEIRFKVSEQAWT